jgi:hypothetical protein
MQPCNLQLGAQKSGDQMSKSTVVDDHFGIFWVDEARQLEVAASLKLCIL